MCFDCRSVDLTDGRDIVPRGNDPILLGPTREGEIARRAEQHGHTIQPAAIEFFVDSCR